MADLLANVWEWLINAENFWSAFFATVFCALAAFELERRHRRSERISSECARANGLISTLGRMLTVLENLQATLPPLKDGGPSSESHRPISGIPTNVPQINFADLDFLLETNDPGDQCAKAHGRVAHAQAQFDSALAQFAERNQLAQRYQQNSSALLMRGESAIAARLQADELSHELSYFAAELNEGLPARIRLFKEVIAELHASVSARYPKRQFLRLFPIDANR